MKFGSRLQQLRAGRNMTQEDLANKFKISKSAIGMYERDEREPSFELLKRFADFFDVSLDYMLGNTDAPNPDRSITHPDIATLEMLNRITPDLLENLKRATPEQLQNIRNAMKYSRTEQEFLADIDFLTPEDLAERYSLKIGERLATREEIEEMVAYIRARRIMRAME